MTAKIGMAACVLAVLPALAALPDEADQLRVLGYDATTGRITLGYEPPGCNETSHNVEYGRLEDVSGYGWSGQECDIGTDGIFDGFVPGAGSYFFVVVPTDGLSREGSYGAASDGQPRPTDTIDPVCAYAQVDADEDGVSAPCDCDDADPLRFPGNAETCNGVDSDCNRVPDDGIPTDGNGCADPGPPVFPETVGTVQLVARTGQDPGDASDGLTVCFCLADLPGSCDSSCWFMGNDGDPDPVSDAWNERAAGQIDVFTVEGVGIPRSDVQRVRIEVGGSGPFDAWTPDCIQLSFDGEPVLCDTAPNVTLGDGPAEFLDWEATLAPPEPDCSCYPSRRTHGPLVGAATQDRARLWVRTDATRKVELRVVETADDLAASTPVAVRYPQAAVDFTEEVEVLGLEPDRDYLYRFDVAGEPGPVSTFRTAAEGPGDVRLAFGSCSDRRYFASWPIFTEVAERDPDLFLFIGDNHYANSEVLDILRQNYRAALERPARAALQASVSGLATWDDHDFLGNNLGGNEPEQNKQKAKRAFDEYWVNPASGCPGSGCNEAYPGVFYTHRVRDVELFVLDGRYHRDVLVDPATECPAELQPTPVEGYANPSVLGPCQTEWLLQRLQASDATFKLLAVGSQWTVEGTNDSWAVYPEAQLELLQRIADQGIEGVVLLSGDVHRSEFRRLPGGGRFAGPGAVKGYTVPEIVASPLARESNVCQTSNEVLFCAAEGSTVDAFGDPQGLFFVVIDVDTDLADPTLTATIHDIDGAPLADWTIARSELQNPAPSGVASGPDFNGDGYADLAVGSPGEDSAASIDAGSYHVLYGSSSGLHSYGNQLWDRELAESDAALGSALASGDFNGDGNDDLAAGAPGGAGSVDVLYGTVAGLSPTGSQLWDQSLSGASAPEPGDAFGFALAAGDFDGDTVADLAIGVPGEDGDQGLVQVLYGASPTGLSATAGPGQQVLFQQVRVAGNRFGAALAAGDFDGDGDDDLAVGAPGGAGQVTVLSGSATGLHDPRELEQDTPGVPDQGEPDDRFGEALAVGNFNGDPFDDLAVGVPGEDLPAASDAGAVQLFFGSRIGGLQGAGAQFWSLDSPGIAGDPASGDGFATALAGADLDGDGRDDLAIGIPGRDVQGQDDAGAVLVLSGGPGGPVSAGALFIDQGPALNTGPEPDDRFGAAVGVGDFNADGYVDLAIGAPGEGTGPADNAGIVNVFHGSATGLVLTTVPTPLSLTRPYDQRWHPGLGTLEGANEDDDAFGAVLP